MSGMEFEDIKPEMPDMGEGVDTFGSRDYAEGEQQKEGERSELAEKAKAENVGLRIDAFLTRKLGENAVRIADVAGNW